MFCEQHLRAGFYRDRRFQALAGGCRADSKFTAIDSTVEIACIIVPAGLFPSADPSNGADIGKAFPGAPASVDLPPVDDVHTLFEIVIRVFIIIFVFHTAPHYESSNSPASNGRKSCFFVKRLGYELLEQDMKSLVSKMLLLRFILLL